MGGGDARCNPAGIVWTGDRTGFTTLLLGGFDGENPMRYTGGLAGGSWMTALAGDLGKGKFEGALLVKNFENLNPANTHWSKNYDIW